MTPTQLGTWSSCGTPGTGARKTLAGSPWPLEVLGLRHGVEWCSLVPLLRCKCWWSREGKAQSCDIEQRSKNRAAAPPLSNLQNCRKEHERKPGCMKTELPWAPMDPFSLGPQEATKPPFVTTKPNKESFIPCPLTLTSAGKPSGYSSNQTTEKIFSLWVFSVSMIYKDQ